jgi:hypothetical protein
MGRPEKQIVEGEASINPRNEGVNPKLVTKNQLFPARKSCFNSERCSDSDFLPALREFSGVFSPVCVEDLSEMEIGLAAYFDSKLRPNEIANWRSPKKTLPERRGSGD